MKTNVRVTTYDAELEFVIQSSLTGRQLFEQVIKTIGLREVWYFGLQYVDSKGLLTWLKLNKKVMSQDVGKRQPLCFKFRAKFFPEDVSEELIQDITVKLFYLQIKDSVLNDEFFCSPETSVLLASYALQAKYGNYNSSYHTLDFLSNDQLLPRRVFNQFRLNINDWLERITNWWSDHHDMCKEIAMMEYLKIAQDLEMYGINFFEIKNKKGTELYLGVDSLGLSIYDKSDKLSPCVGFPWSEIRNVSFNDRKFIIKLLDKKCSDFIFYVPRIRINKNILALCMGNHELYMRRRRPDTIEIQQMKKQAASEKKLKMLDYSKISNESYAREKAEQKQREAEKEMKKMNEILSKTKEELNIMCEKYKKLQKQYDELNKSKILLENKEREMEKLNAQLLSQSHMSEEERNVLISKICLHEEEIQKMRDVVDTKTSNVNSQQLDFDAIKTKNMDSKCFLSEIDDKVSDEGIELSIDEKASMSMVNDELNREINVSVKKKLELLTKELDSFKQQENMTKFDLLHQEKKIAGKDKYKTLKQIRLGNTKRRIDQYEGM
uniref:Moesin/ezrin/radixin homolog 1 n=1 Tax=Strongyloides venezuelensis TaxID=75913 RepID=A0A0K0FC20_STRVS